MQAETSWREGLGPCLPVLARAGHPGRRKLPPPHWRMSGGTKVASTAHCRPQNGSVDTESSNVASPQKGAQGNGGQPGKGHRRALSSGGRGKPSAKLGGAPATGATNHSLCLPCGARHWRWLRHRPQCATLWTSTICLVPGAHDGACCRVQTEKDGPTLNLQVGREPSPHGHWQQSWMKQLACAFGSHRRTGAEDLTSDSHRRSREWFEEVLTSCVSCAGRCAVPRQVMTGLSSVLRPKLAGRPSAWTSRRFFETIATLQPRPSFTPDTHAALQIRLPTTKKMFRLALDGCVSSTRTGAQECAG